MEHYYIDNLHKFQTKEKNMIAFLKTWSNQIIVALMIATIIEMLLPQGKNKKYIKMILGLYVLFSMLNPIIEKVTGTSLTVPHFDYEQYFQEESTNHSLQDFENNNSKLIEQAYIDNMENDLKLKLKQQGYDITNCSIQIESDENSELYGHILQIELVVKKLEHEKMDHHTIQVNEVNIYHGNTLEENKTSALSTQEQEKIKKYLSNQYALNIEKIIIH